MFAPRLPAIRRRPAMSIARFLARVRALRATRAAAFPFRGKIESSASRYPALVSMRKAAFAIAFRRRRCVGAKMTRGTVPAFGNATKRRTVTARVVLSCRNVRQAFQLRSLPGAKLKCAMVIQKAAVAWRAQGWALKRRSRAAAKISVTWPARASGTTSTAIPKMDARFKTHPLAITRSLGPRWATSAAATM